MIPAVIRSSRRRWTLRDLPSTNNLALWLDTSDTSTVILSGSNNIEWRDKSNNARNFAQNIASSQPLFSGGGLVFDGVDDFLWNDKPFIWNTNSTINLFIVARGSAQDDKRLLGEGSSSSNNPMLSFQSGQAASSASDKIASFLRNDTGTVLRNQSALSGTAFDNVQRILQFEDTGSGITGYVDGNLGSTVSYSRTGTLTLNRMSIGAILRASTTFHFTGSIFEIIAVTGSLSLQNSQRIQGYLAHKPGRVNNLSVNHPFKTYTPRK